MFKIYLAGKMSGLKKEDRVNWRKSIQTHFRNTPNLLIINPCDYYDIDTVDYATTTEKEIKAFDLFHVRTSNIIIVNLRHPNSIGTAMELQEAESHKIPIIGYDTWKAPVHPWIEEAITKLCNTEKDLLEYVEKYYLQRMV